MKGPKPMVFSVAVWTLVAGLSAFGRSQDRQKLSGIGGLPIEGHDIVAGIEIVGTKHIDHSKILERVRSNGAELRSGFPLQFQTLCRFKEVLLDMMSEKGFLDAEIVHETRPTYGNPRHLTLKFTITEGKRSRPITTASSPSPAQRCLR